MKMAGHSRRGRAQPGMAPAARVVKMGIRRPQTRYGDEAGLALILTLIIMAATAILITVGITAAVVDLRATLSDYPASRVFYAAEAAG